MAPIEDRATDLELAQSATSDAIARVDRKVDRLAEKVDAMHRVIAESEVRLRTQLGANIAEVEQRLADRIGADLLNDRFDAVMVALDQFQNPPR
jgi:hypothetical protein